MKEDKTVLTVARELANEFGWEVETLTGFNDKVDENRTMLAHKDHDIKLFFYHGYNTGSGKMTIAFAGCPSLDNSERIRVETRSERPNIGCAINKGSKAIMADINRRLMQDCMTYRAEYIDAHNRQLKYNHEEREVKEWCKQNMYKHETLRMEANGNRVHVTGYLTLDQAKSLLG